MTSGVAALTPELLQRLWIEQHLSYRAIARQVGCSDKAVAAAVRRLGLVRPEAPPARLDQATVAEMVRLYTAERLDLRQVAARTGVPRDRVAPALRQAGVRLRMRGSRPIDHLDPQRLRADYEAGASLRALAQREAADDGAIRDALLRAGAAIRPSGGRVSRWTHVLTADYLQEHYVERGQSVRTISRSLGCGYDTVRAALKEHGISVRR